MAVDFKKILSKPADKVERPKALPAGTYFGNIDKYTFDESKQKKTPYIRFFVKVASPGPDVDAASLEGIDLSKKQLQKDFYLTDESLYRLTDFLAALGINITGRSIDECVPETKGMSVQVAVTQRAGGDEGKDIFNDIGSIAAMQ